VDEAHVLYLPAVCPLSAEDAGEGLAEGLFRVAGGGSSNAAESLVA
jgi:hypothetical protein